MDNKSLITSFKSQLLNLSQNYKSFVVAVSGGVDSMVLLDLLRRFQQDFSFKLIVVHFNHQTRIDNSADYELVKQYCGKYDLKLIYHVFEKFEVGNFEAEARSSRYKFLEEIRINNDFELVLTAHHSDDQIETVFLNFIKGSFIDGMAGISSLDLSRKLCRPLLSFSKKQLLEYAEFNAIDFNNDSTNSDSKYLRNFVRNEIIPSVQERVGSLNSIARNSSFYSELATYIDSQVDVFIAEKFINQTLARSDLLDLPNFFRFSLYSKLVGGYDFSVADFWELDKLILTGFASKSRTVRDCKFLVLPGKKIQVLKKVK